MHGRAGVAQLFTQTPLEAEREVRLHPGAVVAAARERVEHRLDAAVEVAAVDVEDSHQRARRAASA
jgi:hypothetical protein